MATIAEKVISYGTCKILPEIVRLPVGRTYRRRCVAAGDGPLFYHLDPHTRHLDTFPVVPVGLLDISLCLAMAGKTRHGKFLRQAHFVSIPDGLYPGI